MIKNGFYAKLASLGFSIIPIGENKVPIGKWKEYQNKHRTKEEIYNLDYDRFGLVTGYKDVECIDVDLKVFSTTLEKNVFWNELLSFLRDSIFDFDKKFVIYKTQNAGYHIIYKTKRVEGNQKLAKLKGHKECLIETRGIGGMIAVYPDNQISEKSYFDVQYITDQDWMSIMRICKSYDYIIPEKEEVKIDNTVKKQYGNNIQDLKPWDDFNNQNSIWDVVKDEFTVYKNSGNKTFIKRIGASSSHSGYIYKDDNLMYLFSTGTIYPHEKQISPFYAYTIKYHNGNFSASAKDLYNQGFGDRLVADIEEKKKNLPDNSKIINDYVFNKSDLNFPIEIFPKPYQNYIMECNEKLDSVIDYMGCSLLWVVSILCGNRFSIRVKNGWNENPVVWFSLVGRPGAGKTPSIKRILYPLIKENNNQIKEYLQKKQEFDDYDSLDKKEKEKTMPVDNPKKGQFIADDITLEALVDLHECVPTGVGVFKDELAGWLKDMNKYREGSDLEFWLSTWSGSSVNLNRLTRRGSFVENPFIPVIGGIQPGILNELYTQDKKDNGFMDRMLISYPDIIIPEYNELEISHEAIDWYNSSIIKLRKELQRVSLEYEDDKIKCNFSDRAKKAWIKKFNEITEKQNSDDENEYFKSMYPKQKSYIPRFAFLLNILNTFTGNSSYVEEINEESMLGAIKLSDYFVATAKKIKFENKESDDIKKSIDSKSLSNLDKVRDAYKVNPKFNRSQMADFLGVSRQTVYNYVAQIESDNIKKK